MRILLTYLVLALAQLALAANVPGRYILELSTEPVTDHVFQQGKRSTLRSAAADSHRTRIRSEQQDVRRRLQEHGVVIDSVDTLANALIVQAADSRVLQLAAIPGVKKVHPVRTVRMLLDRAIAVNKVADAWNLLPADSAGRGIKIAIIDSGIDIQHPGFQDPSLTMPESFPKATSDADLIYANNKVIVARSYVNLLSFRDPDSSAQDHVGHGTALAMIAAGVRNAGTLSAITGVAPKAYLGNYKVFGTPGFNDDTSTDVILKAMDDALADGMDIINLSLGYDPAPRLNEDPAVEAVERATRAGVIVVVSAGNNGSQWGTLASPASAPSAIAVGASRNDRTFATTVEAAGLPAFMAVLSNGSVPANPITAAFADVASLDTNGLACEPLPPNSATGRIALILRGTCTFESKLNNVQQAGAVAGLVYAAQNAPEPIAMSVGVATLPAEMISHSDGIALKQALVSDASRLGTLRFTKGYVPIDPSRLATFSAAGPNVDATIKPDLVAVGTDLYVATQKLDFNGEMYDPSGYILVDGTSFSAPLVAGAAALLKSARPGLSVDQYRSLLINTASPLNSSDGAPARVQQAGAGSLNVAAALTSTVTAYPTALSFGPGGPDPSLNKTLSITNTGSSADFFSIAVTPSGSGAAPAPATATVQIAPGASTEVPIVWQASGLAAGAYDGFFRIVGSASGAEIRVPYWYAVTSEVPAGITILSSLSSARRGSLRRDAVLLRVTDSAGLPIVSFQPTVSVVSGDGTVESLVSHDDESPGLLGLSVRLGFGSNVFRIVAGDVAVEVVINGT